MISTQHKFIYLHAPKTGGNSIQTVLLPVSDDNKKVADGFSGVDRFDVVGPQTRKKHVHLRDYHAELQTELANFKVVLSVRHPWERLVSFYFSRHRWEKAEKPEARTEPYFDETDFWQVAENLVPMSEFVALDGNEREISLRLLRFENLQADFIGLLTEMDLIGKVASLPHLNSTTAKPELVAKIRASADLKAQMTPLLAVDMETFGYDF